MSADDRGGVGETRSRWNGRRLLLVGSLILNVFLIAMIVGWALHRPPGGWRGGAPEVRALAHMQQEDGVKRRAAMRRILAEVRPQMREIVAEIEAQRRKIAEMVGAEPFDKAALGAAFAELRGLQMRRREILLGRVADVLESGGPEVRSRYAQYYVDMVDRRAERRREREERRRESDQ